MAGKKKLKIIFEDKNILIVEKNAKLLTIASDKSNHTLYQEVYAYLHKKNQKVFIVHRLDYDTSGLILFAKNIKMKNYFQNNWESVIRKYYGITLGVINHEGEIRSYLAETKTHLVYETNNKTIGKLAITKYKPVKNNNKYTLLDLNILTGRKNQIRVQLNNLGYPLLGDKTYGKTPENRLYLHAYFLEFYYPITGKKEIFSTAVPKEFSSIISN